MAARPRPAPTETPKVDCKTCLEDLPGLEPSSQEAKDYVLHYCGLECYEQWARESKEKSQEEKVNS